MWAITKPISTAPVIAMTNFFPIMLCQKAIKRVFAATLGVITSPTGWTGLKLVSFDMPTLLSQRLVSRRPLRFQHFLAQIVLTDVRSCPIFLGLDANRD